MKRVPFPAILLLSGHAALARTSLEQLNVDVDKRVAAWSSFDDALADPDPRRALAAMQILIEKGESISGAWRSGPACIRPI